MNIEVFHTDFDPPVQVRYNFSSMDVTLPGRPAAPASRIPFRWLLAASLVAFITFGAAIRLVALDRFPPGLHFDEAVYGLLARDILNGARPVFFSAWTGREPLYMYLMAAIQAMVGVNTVAIRLTSALAGTLTLPLTYLLGRTLFNRRIGLLAAGLIATNYWHLTVSRNGYPNVLIPPLEALSFYFLWQGYCHPTHHAPRITHHAPRTTRWGTDYRWLATSAVGGAFAGLVLYTYLAARFYPVTLLAIAVYALAVDRRRFVQRLPALSVAVIVMILVASPLAVHFIRHPADFVERADQVLIFTQVSGPSEGLRVLLTNVWQTALAFVVRGDPRWHYNLPGKPIFDPLVAVLFLAGIIVALRRWQGLRYGIVLIWTAVMCLPGILTADLQPATQRMFGVFPVLMMLPALGLDRAWCWVVNRRQQLAHAVVPVVMLLFIWEGYSTLQTYFRDWVWRYDTYEIFNGDYAQMAGIARAELAAGHTVTFVSEHYKHPTLAYLAPETMQDAVWTMGALGLVIPNRGADEIVYLAPREPFPPGSRVDRRLRAWANFVQTVNDLADRPAFTVYRVSGSLPLAAEPGVGPTFNGEAAFVDAEWPDTVRRDAPIAVTVRWQVLQAVQPARTFALHLVDAQGLRWAQTDEMSYLTEQWQPGDRVEQWFTLAVDPRTPAGTYTITMVLADEAAHPLPVLGHDGIPQGTWLELGPVTLEAAGGLVEDVHKGSPMEAALQVLDHSRVEGSLTPGMRLTASVVWQKTTAPPSEPTVKIEFVDGNGRIWHVVEQPVAGQYAPALWHVGEIVRAQYALDIPPDAPPGPSRVRLRLNDAILDLGQVDIQSEGRLFTLPDIDTPLRATFGDKIRFLGYDLPETTFAPGDGVPLTLYWQALQAIAGDYKVFTHLLDPAGQLRGQKDSVPAEGTRPTAGWAPGEIIIDRYELPIWDDAPPGSYRIEIGLYDATTMARLSAFDAGGKPLPDNRILLAHTLQIEGRP